MNVFEKLQLARVKLQETSIKKTGNNKFAGYTYYELGDFLPVINFICSELKITPIVTFESEYAKMIIFDAEKPDDFIEFKSPMADASLKGCHAIQNMGAVETYQRRYLYMTAFEIVEADALDGTNGKPPEKSPNRNKTCVLSQKQIQRLCTLSDKAGFTTAQVESQIGKKFNIGSIKELTKEQYEQVCNGYERLINEKEGK